MSFEFKYTYIQDISCCIPKTMAKRNEGGDHNFYMKGMTSFMYFMVLRKPSHCI